jgi:hypothetical protein
LLVLDVLRVWVAWSHTQCANGNFVIFSRLFTHWLPVGLLLNISFCNFGDGACINIVMAGCGEMKEMIATRTLTAFSCSSRPDQNAPLRTHCSIITCTEQSLRQVSTRWRCQSANHLEPCGNVNVSLRTPTMPRSKRTRSGLLCVHRALCHTPSDPTRKAGDAHKGRKEGGQRQQGQAGAENPQERGGTRGPAVLAFRIFSCDAHTICASLCGCSRWPTCGPRRCRSCGRAGRIRASSLARIACARLLWAALKPRSTPKTSTS